MADAETATETAAAAETSGDSATTEETAATARPEAAETTGGEKSLGDAGKKALDAMKAERNQFRDDLKAIRAEFDAFKAKAEGKEAEFTAAQEAQRVKDEALAAANQRILKAELRAAAKGKVADEAIADLPALMNLSEIEVGSDGEVDPSQIAAAIDDLITKKPYLAAQSGKRFQGTGDGGPRNAGNAQPSQLSKADLDRMSAAGQYDEITEAKKAGRFNDLLGIKS